MRRRGLGLSKCAKWRKREDTCVFRWNWCHFSQDQLAPFITIFGFSKQQSYTAAAQAEISPIITDANYAKTSHIWP